MADVANTLQQWSVTRSSNLPSGGTTVGTGWDDNLREMQGVVRGALASKGADIASASTTDLGAVEGLFHDITGTTTITAFGTVSAGIWKVIKFEDALTLTHNGTSLIIPGGANITTANGDMAGVTSEGSGNWRVNWYVRANGGPVTLAGSSINALSAEASPAADDLLAIHDTSAGTTDKMAFSDFFKVINALTEDTAPDLAADFVVTYDASASAAKKVLPNNLGRPALGTPQATTSGTEFDFTIPAWAKQISVTLKGVSLSGTDNLIVQLGDAGGIENAGYTGTCGSYSSAGTNVSSLTAGFAILAGGNGATISGALSLTLHNASDFTWAAQGTFSNPGDTTSKTVGGYKTLSAALTTVRLTRTGTDTFDAGAVNVVYT